MSPNYIIDNLLQWKLIGNFIEYTILYYTLFYHYMFPRLLHLKTL